MIRSSASSNLTVAALDRLGLLYAGLAAIGFSGKAILVKLAYRYGTDAETLLALRMAFSLPFFIAMGWFRRRSAQLNIKRLASPLHSAMLFTPGAHPPP